MKNRNPVDNSGQASIGQQLLIAIGMLLFAVLVVGSILWAMGGLFQDGNGPF